MIALLSFHFYLRRQPSGRREIPSCSCFSCTAKHAFLPGLMPLSRDRGLHIGPCRGCASFYSTGVYLLDPVEGVPTLEQPNGCRTEALLVVPVRFTQRCRGRGRKLVHQSGAENSAMGNDVHTSKLLDIFLLLFIYLNTAHQLASSLLLAHFCWGRRLCY